MNGVEEANQFAWITRSPLQPAGCLTLVEHTRPAELCARLGEQVDDLGTMSLADLPAHDPAGPYLVALRQLDGWTLAVEINGWQGSRPEVLSRLADAGRTVSIVWSVVGSPRFTYAQRGEIVTMFEQAVPEHRHGSDPDALESLRAGLPWLPDERAEQAQPLGVLLALTARLTGLTPTPNWLAGTFQVFSVQPWPEGLPTAVVPEIMPLTYQEPPLAWALPPAPPDTLRQVAQRAAELAVNAVGLADQEAVVAALADPVAGAAPIDRLSAAVLREARKGTRSRWPSGAYQALDAVRHLANPSPLAAAYQGVEAARTALTARRQPLDQLRADLTHLLDNPPPPSGSYGITDPTDQVAEPSGYRWLSRHWLRYAGSLTYAHGSDPTALAHALGGDTAATTAVPHLTWVPTLFLRAEDGWAVAVESGEPRRGHQQALQRIDADTIVSVQWSGRNRVRLFHLSHGRVLAVLDPLHPDQITGDDPSTIHHHLAGMRLPATGDAGNLAQVPTLVALAHRITGLALPPSTLDQPHLQVALPDQANL